MRLIDAAPRWAIASWKDNDGSVHEGNGRIGMGLTFLCPCGEDHRAGVFFANPIDGKPPYQSQTLWNREGETFETLTLSPSINIIYSDENGKPYSHWHGYLRGGQLISV